jgi:hypothetical protein
MNEGIGWYSHWWMPFEKNARVAIRNESEDAIYLTGDIVAAKYEWTDNSMHFHAGWRAEHPISTRPRQDWRYMDVKGKGRYVGNSLNVANPVKDWWGEGDEKIYVDGETFPSHFGTGTEDYYSYAWCNNQVFSHAYHNQPRCDGPGNYGQTSVNRFHILDNIPFEESFVFDMEVWHWKECEVGMAATSYWYARPGSETVAPTFESADLVVHPVPELPPVWKKEGALEGEAMEIVKKSGGKTSVQTGAWPWSQEQQLWWVDTNVGDTLTLEFDVEKTGKYDIIGVFTKAIDYGIAKLSINDKEVEGSPIDFYNNGVIVTPETALGTFKLKKGKNTLVVEITGQNEKALDNRMFGLDYLLLTPTKK